MSEHVNCCKCGCSSKKWFECEIEKDEQGIPCGFEITKGPFDFGGFGTPDHMVMSTLWLGAEAWKKKKTRKTGDFYVSVAMFLAEQMKEYLGPETLKMISILEPEESH